MIKDDAYIGQRVRVRKLDDLLAEYPADRDGDIIIYDTVMEDNDRFILLYNERKYCGVVCEILSVGYYCAEIQSTEHPEISLIMYYEALEPIDDSQTDFDETEFLNMLYAKEM